MNALAHAGAVVLYSVGFFLLFIAAMVAVFKLLNLVAAWVEEVTRR